MKYTDKFALSVLLLVVSIFMGTANSNPVNAEWRQILIRDTDYRNYPSISFGGQHPHSIDVCKTNPTYGAMCIDIGSVRTFTWNDAGITVTYPALKGLYAPYGQSIKVHPDDFRILLYAGDCEFWNYTTGDVAGVYRSIDYGENWTKVSNLSPNFAITYPTSNSTMANPEKRRGNHDNFAVSPTDSSHWFWQRNQLYYVRITINSLAVAPRLAAYGYHKDIVTPREIITDTNSNAWMLVTDADVDGNWIEGIVNYDEYFGNKKQFTKGSTISSLLKGGGSGDMVAPDAKISKVEVISESNWLYESTDAGVTWTPASGSLDTKYWLDNVKGIVYKNNGSIVYIYTSQGLFTYSPADNTLSALGDLPINQEVRDLVTDPHDSNHLMCTIGEFGGGLYESKNGGRNWTKIQSVGSRAHCISISPENENNLVFFLDGGGHEWYSSDGGSRWSKGAIAKDVFDMRIHVPTGSTYRTCAVKHHPTDGTRLYAYGSAAVWYSHDSGATWNCAKNYTGAAIYTNKCFGFAPNDGNTWGAGIADYYGVLVTHDNANSFILGGYNDYKNSWLKDPDIVPAMSTAKYSMNIAFSPLNSNILIAGFGSMNQAKFARSTDGGQTFSLIDKKQPTNKNYWIRWNKRDPKKVYLGSLYSDDGGATLKPIDESGLTGSNYQFCGMDGSDNNKVWASAFSNKRYVAYSSDGGLTWANSFDLGWSTGYVAGDLEVFEIFDKNNVYSMCGSYFKSYHRDLVYSIKQPSLKWQKNDWVAANVKDASGDYNSFGNCIQSMAIDPRNKNIIYVVLRTNGIDKIWRSANHGVTWDSIQKNLSRARISGITVKPDTGEVLIGGQMGFWVYPAYGSSISDDNPLWKKWGNSGKPDA